MRVESKRDTQKQIPEGERLLMVEVAPEEAHWLHLPAAGRLIHEQSYAYLVFTFE